MNSSSIKSLVIRDMVKLMPPLIRDSLLEDSKFCEAYELGTNVAVSFHDIDVSVERSALFNAVRNVLAGKSAVDITDLAGHQWVLSYSNEKQEPLRLVLSCDNQSIFLPDLSILSPDKTVRLRAFHKSASEVNMPPNSQDEWCNILSKRALEDNEVDVFLRDILDTPVAQARFIRAQLIDGYTNIASLVPPSRRYFERLVGKYDGSSTIHEYATNCIRTLLDELTTWRSSDGFLFSLFLSSHSSLTEEIKVDQLDRDDLVSAFDFLVKRGDRISQMGAIEIGLRILSSRTEIESFLVTLIEQIRDDTVDEPTSGLKLLSTLFILVDGELSKTRLFSAQPPFYRRLAALSQAALIHRQLLDSTVDIDNFSEWAFNNCTEQYYLQSLTDIRLEPRWDPEFAAPSQLKAEFLSRIMLAAKNYEQNLKESEVFNLVLCNKLESIQSYSNFLNAYFPGPLEGGAGMGYALPAEIAEAIETQLGAEKVGFSSFIALINSALLFRISPDQVASAIQTLKRSNHRLADIENRAQLLTLLNGLATVAAVARNPILADELRIISRKYRSGSRFSLSINEIMRFCLITAASHAAPQEWREFVSDWITELAFSDLDRNDGQQLYWYLQCLCHIVPELWFTCGRADAALLAFNAI